MQNVTVADTSCIILFYKIEELEILHKLFGRIYITDEVKKESKHPLPDWIEVTSLQAKLDNELSNKLDIGEATSIALASQNQDALLIIDESKERKVAKERGISITGSIGVLIAAKNRGHIQSIKPTLEKIRETNFRISDSLIDKALTRANEI